MERIHRATGAAEQFLESSHAQDIRGAVRSKSPSAKQSGSQASKVFYNDAS